MHRSEIEPDTTPETPAPPSPAEEITAIADRLSERLEIFPTDDPVLARLRAFNVDRSSVDKPIPRPSFPEDKEKFK